MQQAALYGMEKDMVGVRRALYDEFGVRIYVVSRVHEQTTFESTRRMPQRGVERAVTCRCVDDWLL